MVANIVIWPSESQNMHEYNFEVVGVTPLKPMACAQVPVMAAPPPSALAQPS